MTRDARSRGADLDRRRLVVVNWRDRRHAQAGGAEQFCHSVAERLAARGADVTYLTSRPPGAPREERTEGVRIVHRGSTFGVYPAALVWLWRNRREIDAVIDSQNGLPFFAPLAVGPRTPVVLVIHHVHQQQFEEHFPRPLSSVGKLLEGPVSRWVYGRRAIAVVSPSTRSEVRRQLRLRGPIHVTPNGVRISPAPQPAPPRSSAPSIVCVGRLVRHKRLELLIEALPEVLVERPALRVEIVGDGPELEDLKRRAAAAGLSHAVTFHGRICAEARDDLLARAWLSVNVSAGEGWGLTVIEANALGIPVLGIRVPGVQDSVLDGRTGWLVDRPADLAPGILGALEGVATDDEARPWSARARAWAASFSWETTTDRLAELLATEAQRLRREPASRRRGSDLVTRVELDPASVPAGGVGGLRDTDVVHVGEDGASVLLYGADETDAGAILSRLGLIEAAAGATVARPMDLLGLRAPVQAPAPDLGPLPPVATQAGLRSADRVA